MEEKKQFQGKSCHKKATRNEKRDRILLIAEEEQIVWIPGMRMSAAYQIGDQTTKILKIKIVEE